MTRRGALPSRPADIRQFRTAAAIDSAITKLKRRTADLERLRSDNVRHDDDRVGNVEHSIRDTIREEFGGDSPEYKRHQYFKVDDGPRYARSDFMGGGDYDAEDQQRFNAAVPGAITRVDDLVRRLVEKRADLTEETTAPRVAFEGRTLNPEIGSAARGLYGDGHYAQAVFEAGKALIGLVKTKSARQDLDGVSLMQTVFSVKAPILSFNDRSDQSDIDEQQGLMHLFIGAAMGIRNPIGHRVGATEQPDRALQYLELFSLLADRLSDAKKVK